MVKWVILMFALAVAIAVASVVVMLNLEQEPSTGIAGGSPGETAAITSPRLGVDLLKKVDPPVPVPPGEFTDASGKVLHIADFRGRSVLLNFWATWCAPCLQELPALDRVAAELKAENFVVLPISTDRQGTEVVKPFYEKLQLKELGLYFDPKSTFSQAAKVQVLPTTLLIDKDGRIVVAGEGAVEWDVPEVKAFLREQAKR